MSALLSVRTPQFGYATVVLPRAILLDLDGTLVDSEPVHAEGISRYLCSRGLDLSPGERDFVIGHAWQEIYTELDVERRVGVSLAELQRGTAIAEAQMREEGIAIRVLDGAAALIERLVAMEIPRCIVSGSNRAEIGSALELLGFGDHLSFYYGAEDYACGKPAPDGYLKAADRLGVQPRECVVVEDSVAGISSARAAGMRVIATAAVNPPSNHPAFQDQSEAHRIVQDLHELGEALLREVMTMEV